jgi:hypothetical protein
MRLGHTKYLLLRMTGEVEARMTGEVEALAAY